jgi:hypothetical protein
MDFRKLQETKFILSTTAASLSCAFAAFLEARSFALPQFSPRALVAMKTLVGISLISGILVVVVIAINIFSLEVYLLYLPFQAFFVFLVLVIDCSSVV